jgi:hypothetical protein
MDESSSDGEAHLVQHTVLLAAAAAVAAAASMSDSDHVDEEETILQDPEDAGDNDAMDAVDNDDGNEGQNDQDGDDDETDGELFEVEFIVRHAFNPLQYEIKWAVSHSRALFSP